MSGIPQLELKPQSPWLLSQGTWGSSHPQNSREIASVVQTLPKAISCIVYLLFPRLFPPLLPSFN